MPIVDGLTSTKMIRSYEKTHAGILSERATNNGRVPIIAVSASLLEKDREKYIATGFDGWVLKPIDFQRLSVLLNGIVDDKVRDRCLYKTGEWENGGWFAPRCTNIPSADTKPDEAVQPSTMPGPVSYGDSAGDDPSEDTITKEQDRLAKLQESTPTGPFTT